jgi:hypothetical protein
VRFHFCAYNHGDFGRQTLVDMFRWLRAGLQELGHEVTYSPDTADPSAVNVLWEFFVPVEVGERLAASDLTYGLIVTEYMDGVGFNIGSPLSAAADRRDEAHRIRGEGFRAAARSAKFFWSMVESNVVPLRELAPASFVELGYADSLVPKLTEEPTIDFSFTGILTPYRAKILEKLEERAVVVRPKSLALLSVEERDALFWTTRINLSPNKTDNWQMPSPVRVGMALLAKRGIALDRTPQQTRQSRLVESCPEGMSFVDFALSQLGGNWREAARIAFDRFRSELPMKEITERILEESLASVIP